MGWLRRTARHLFREDIFFYTYRWLAWLLACGAVFVPGMPPAIGMLPLWLLIFTFALNILATALAHSYVRIARQRPALLAFDMLLGLSLVWASGGGVLPFLPYALASLVLPARLFDIRGSIVASFAFALLDQLVLVAASEGETLLLLLGRVLLPFGFVLLCKLPTAAARQPSRASTPPPANQARHRPTAAGRAQPPASRANRSSLRRMLTTVDNQAERPPSPPPTRPPITALEADAVGISRSLGTPATAQPGQRQGHNSPPRPVPPLDVKLETMLNQMADAFSRDANIALRLSLAAENQQLSAGKRIALAHLAQEALRNVQQHAHAHAAWLALQYESSMVILTVQDDGVGLLDGTYQRPGLHALRMIRYRLAEFDGQLEVFEGEQGGVTVRGTLPLTNN